MTKQIWAFSLSLFAAAAAAQTKPIPEPRYTQEAKDAVRRTLRDPISAQFQGVRQYKDGTVCGQFNGKNGFGGYAGFRNFVVTRNGKSETLHFATDPLWCSDTPNKELRQAQAQLQEDIERCSYEMSETDPPCAPAQASAELVRRLGGRPRSIPMPYAVAGQSYDLWAGLCETSGDRKGASCRTAADAENKFTAVGGKPRSRAEIRQEHLEMATKDFELSSPKCVAELLNIEASSCRQAAEAEAKIKVLTGRQDQ